MSRCESQNSCEFCNEKSTTPFPDDETEDRTVPRSDNILRRGNHFAECDKPLRKPHRQISRVATSTTSHLRPHKPTMSGIRKIVRRGLITRSDGGYNGSSMTEHTQPTSRFILPDRCQVVVLRGQRPVDNSQFSTSNTPAAELNTPK